MLVHISDDLALSVCRQHNEDYLPIPVISQYKYKTLDLEGG